MALTGIDRTNFREFLATTISPVGTNSGPDDYDLRVDPYGNFKIRFMECDDKRFSEPINGYGPNLMGGMLLRYDVHQYIKSINGVEINAFSKHIELPGIQYALHRLIPMNSGANIKMDWLSTKTPFVESIFVPWMQDNTIHGHFPIVKADLEITFPKVTGLPDLRYKYYGVRPNECAGRKMTNEPVTEFYRTVSFDYDYFYVFTEKGDNI